jgi:hypothetical protein
MTYMCADGVRTCVRVRMPVRVRRVRCVWLGLMYGIDVRSAFTNPYAKAKAS